MWSNEYIKENILTPGNVLTAITTAIAWTFGTSIGCLVMFNYWLWMM
jgi:hypothetical protein